MICEKHKRYLPCAVCYIEINGQDITLSEKPQEHHEILSRVLWKELHTKKNPTPKWFLEWLFKVPNTSSCGGCQQWAIEWLTNNHPEFDNWFPWSVRFHNSVNLKLTKKQWTLEEAIQCWIDS